jgi:sugar phosphate isomerase/epimerase
VGLTFFMKIVLSTGCLYENPLSDVFKIAQISGFDGVELLIDRNKSNITPDDIRALSEKYGIPVVSIHSPFVACDGWGGFWNRIEKTIELGKALSVQLVNFHPPRGVLLYHNLNGRFPEHIENYINSVKDFDITLTIENLPCPKHLIGIPLLRRVFPSLVDNTCQIAKFAKDNGICVTFDTTHVGTTGQDIPNIYDTFKGTIANIHLSDYDGITQHLLPGRGKLPLKKFLKLLKNDGYDGFITLETHPFAMQAKDMKRAISNAKYCLSYITDIWL